MYKKNIMDFGLKLSKQQWGLLYYFMLCSDFHIQLNQHGYTNFNFFGFFYLKHLFNIYNISMVINERL